MRKGRLSNLLRFKRPQGLSACATTAAQNLRCGRADRAADLTHVTTRGTRTGLFVLVATILTAGICGDAVAKTGKGRLRAHHPAAEVRGGELATGEQTRLGPMRYYGGPKSPMWRGPTEN